MNTQIDQHPLQPGEMVKEYQIDSVLGRGGFGITYLARDTHLQNKVAIKEYFPLTAWRDDKTRRVISHSLEDQDHFLMGLERFKREGTVLAGFDHPNIVRVLRLIPENDTAYLVMPYVDGITLEEFLKDLKRNLDHKELADLFMPIMDGLRAVHELGMLHLDISPDNIFLRSKGAPFLIDFGGARHQLGLTSSRASFLVAKDCYAPPEQYSGMNLQAQADIYALAACMYESISGISPPPAQQRSQAAVNSDKDPMQPLVEMTTSGNFSKSFLQEIDLALSLPVNRRPASIRDFQEKLFPNNQAQPGKRKWLAGLVLLAVILMVTWFIFHLQTQPLPADTNDPVGSDPAPSSTPGSTNNSVAPDPSVIRLPQPGYAPEASDADCDLGFKPQEECQ